MSNQPKGTDDYFKENIKEIVAAMTADKIPCTIYMKDYDNIFVDFRSQDKKNELHVWGENDKNEEEEVEKNLGGNKAIQLKEKIKAHEEKERKTNIKEGKE